MKNASRLRHFILQNNRFAKTGSGQTWGKHTQKRERERERVAFSYLQFGSAPESSRQDAAAAAAAAAAGGGGGAAAAAGGGVGAGGASG